MFIFIRMKRLVNVNLSFTSFCCGKISGKFIAAKSEMRASNPPCILGNVVHDYMVKENKLKL